MTVRTKSELLATAAIIKANTVARTNTAALVGGLLEDLIDSAFASRPGVLELRACFDNNYDSPTIPDVSTTDKTAFAFGSPKVSDLGSAKSRVVVEVVFSATGPLGSTITAFARWGDSEANLHIHTVDSTLVVARFDVQRLGPNYARVISSIQSGAAVNDAGGFWTLPIDLSVVPVLSVQQSTNDYLTVRGVKFWASTGVAV